MLQVSVAVDFGEVLGIVIAILSRETVATFLSVSRSEPIRTLRKTREERGTHHRRPRLLLNFGVI